MDKCTCSIDVPFPGERVYTKPACPLHPPREYADGFFLPLVSSPLVRWILAPSKQAYTGRTAKGRARKN